MTEDEAADAFFKLKGETEAVLNFSDETILDTTGKIKNEANIKMKNYFKNHYNVEINVN
jgi:hypothetical protein